MKGASVACSDDRHCDCTGVAFGDSCGCPCHRGMLPAEGTKDRRFAIGLAMSRRRPKASA